MFVNKGDALPVYFPSVSVEANKYTFTGKQADSQQLRER